MVMTRLLGLVLLIAVQGHVQGDRPARRPLRLAKTNELKQSTLQLEENLEKAVQMPITETTHESFMSRMGNSIITALLGLCLIPFSLTLMWMNELRNARQESILQLGTTEVRSINSKSVDSENHGTLVHLNDAIARGLNHLEDQRFPAVSLKGGLRLRSTCEVFQWEEIKNSKKSKDSLGGGETTTTTYSYAKKWCKFSIDSANFKEPQHRNTVALPGLQVGEQEKVNSSVQYGEGFYLPETLVKSLNKWEDGSGLIKGTLQFASKTFEKMDTAGAENWYYYPKRPSPEVGDVRVRFEYVPDGPCTVMALQCEGKGPGASFMPYRLVSRGFCGLPEEVLKEKLLAQGKKSSDELYEEDAWQMGPLACLCCCCNLVTRCFSWALPPQIFACFHGHLSQQECMEQLHVQGQLLKWGIRVLSWLLLYAGCYMLFKPLIVFLDILPFIGKYVSSGAGWVLGLFIFLLTAVLATVVICLAYLLYHPLMAVVCLACLGLLAGTICGLARVF